MWELGSVGIIGLGSMGLPVAELLRSAHIDVVGTDVDSERLSLLRACGGRPCTTPAEVASEADVVMTSLPHAAALRDVAIGEAGLISSSGSSSMRLVEMSTLSVEDKEWVQAALGPHGWEVVDCPLSGTAAQARSGDLVVYASGDPTTLRLLQPLFDRFSRATYDMGTFGNGTRLKLVANLLVAVHNAVAAEALVLAGLVGLDVPATLLALTDGAGTSRMLEIRGPLMVANSYKGPGMRLELFMKDVALIEELSHSVRAPAPFLPVVRSLYRTAMAQGRGQDDTACVYEVLRAQAVRGGEGDGSGTGVPVPDKVGVPEATTQNRCSTA